MKSQDILRAMGEIRDQFIETAAPGKRKKRNFRYLVAGGTLAACLLIFLSIGIIYRTAEPSQSRLGKGQNQQMANPFISCTTLKEAEKTAGFELLVPDSCQGSTGQKIEAVKNQLIQVIYQDGSGKTILMIRKATGSEDVSGDYNTYDQETVVKEDKVSIRLRGNTDTVSVADWTKDGYAYAIEAQDHPLAQKEMLTLVKQVK